VRYRGFESEERLLVTALLEGDAEPLPEAEARALLKLPLEDAERLEPPLDIADDEMEDAIEEALFVDQTRVADAEQKRFERQIEQVERFIEDQTLVLKRQRADLASMLDAAAKKRDAALGADARARAEEELVALQERSDGIDARIERLQTRDDPDYQRWRQRAHDRRYAAPEAARILDVELVLD